MPARRATTRPSTPPREPSDGRGRARRARSGSSRDDALALLALSGWSARGVHVGNADLRGSWVHARPASRRSRPPRPRPSWPTRDEDKTALDSAVKANDGFFTTFFVSPYSRYIARWAARRGLDAERDDDALDRRSAPPPRPRLRDRRAPRARRRRGPAAGRVHARLRRRPARPLHAPVLQARRVAGLDLRPRQGVHGLRRARARRRAGSATTSGCSPARRWRCRPRATRSTSASATRMRQERAERRASAAAASSRSDVRPPRRRAARAPRARAARRARRRTRPQAAALRARLRAARPLAARDCWAKRILALPIGERFALISLTAALFGHRAPTFIALLAWGGVAAVYTSPGACCARRRRDEPRATAPAAQRARGRDDGPLARALGRAGPRAALPAVALRRRGHPRRVATVAGGAARRLAASGAPPSAGSSCRRRRSSGAPRGRGRLAWLVAAAAARGRVRRPAVAHRRWPTRRAAGLLRAAVRARLPPLRHRLPPAPPARGAAGWTRSAAGGWDGRLLAAAVLAAAGVLRPRFSSRRPSCSASLFVADSCQLACASARRARPPPYEDEEVEDA